MSVLGGKGSTNQVLFPPKITRNFQLEPTETVFESNKTPHLTFSMRRSIVLNFNRYKEVFNNRAYEASPTKWRNIENQWFAQTHISSDFFLEKRGLYKMVVKYMIH